jgi:Rap1a immunity proteins
MKHIGYFLALALELPAHAGPAGMHPFPWMTGAQMLRMLEHPASQAEAAAAVAYLQGVMDASADRTWCYSTTKPGTALLQPALTDKLRTLAPEQSGQSAALIAVAAWQEKWPCTARCCHG